jgi:formamidopyrimidine-DNA glycosylase
VPELPEVETIRRHLAPHVEGRTVARMEILDARWCDPAAPAEVEAAVAGRRVEALGRRGKYLVWELGDEVFLVMHLRMTGNLLLAGDGAARPHLRVRIELGSGKSILFTDPRRFGTGVVLLGRDALDDYFASRLGVEPLGPDFTADALRALARGRRAPVKAFLLSQERIAGVGNIYADEALFRARIHPLRPVGTLRRAQIEALRDAVVESLKLGIDSRGATIDDFRHPDGASGSFQTRFLVHLREGEPCPRCGRPIVKLRAAGRGTYVCEGCQPKPRRRRATGARSPAAPSARGSSRRRATPPRPPAPTRPS